MYCPKCNFRQVCPCQGCSSRRLFIKDDRAPWIWNDKDVIECSKCGLKNHVDEWALLEEGNSMISYIKDINAKNRNA